MLCYEIVFKLLSEGNACVMVFSDWLNTALIAVCLPQAACAPFPPNDTHFKNKYD